MEKVFVVLSDEDQTMLHSICVDKDPQEALDFVLKRIVPQLKKISPCLGEMGIPTR